MGMGASCQAVDEVASAGPSNHAAKPAGVPKAVSSSALEKELFISYKKADCGTSKDGGDGFALMLKEAMEGNGWGVFLDVEGLDGGARWDEALAAAVGGCKALIAICSKGFNDSVWCVREVALADDTRKVIIPIFHSGVYPPPKLMMRLSSIQSIPGGKPLAPWNKAKFDELVALVDKGLRANGLVPAAHAAPVVAAPVAQPSPIVPAASSEAGHIEHAAKAAVKVKNVTPSAELLIQQYNLREEIASKMVAWGLLDVSDFNFITEDMVKELGLKPLEEALVNRLVQAVKAHTAAKPARIDAFLRMTPAARKQVADELLDACKSEVSPSAVTISGLLDRGVDVNCTDTAGKTAITWAVEHNHTEALKLLLASGAAYGSSSLPSWSTVRVAPTTKELLQQFSIRVDIALKLLELGVSEVDDLKLIDSDAIKSLELKRLEESSLQRLIHEVKGQAALKATRANTALTLDAVTKQSLADELLAACKGESTPSPTTITTLLNKGADVDYADEDGRTPLSFAAANGHTEVAKLLIISGATVDKVNKEGWTPLHYAAFGGKTEVLHVLLASGAVVDKLANDGSTPLSWAAGKAQLNCTELLYQWGGNINAPNKAGNTALMGAAYWGHEDCLRFLLKHGAKVDMVAVGGKNALAYAEDQKKTTCVELLQKHMAGTSLD